MSKENAPSGIESFANGPRQQLEQALTGLDARRGGIQVKVLGDYLLWRAAATAMYSLDESATAVDIQSATINEALAWRNIQQGRLGINGKEYNELYLGFTEEQGSLRTAWDAYQEQVKSDKGLEGMTFDVEKRASIVMLNDLIEINSTLPLPTNS